MSKTTKIHKVTERYLGTQLKIWRWKHDTGTRVLRSFARIRGSRGFIEDEALQILDWAMQAEINYAFLELIRKGKIGVDLRKDGEVTFWPIPPHGKAQE